MGADEEGGGGHSVLGFPGPDADDASGDGDFLAGLEAVADLHLSSPQPDVGPEGVVAVETLGPVAPDGADRDSGRSLTGILHQMDGKGQGDAVAAPGVDGPGLPGVLPG